MNSEDQNTQQLANQVTGPDDENINDLEMSEVAADQIKGGIVTPKQGGVLVSNDFDSR